MVASGHDAVVWSRRHYGETELIGCVRRADRRTPLIDGASVVFGPLAKDVDVAGPLVAYAANVIEDAYLPDSTACASRIFVTGTSRSTGGRSLKSIAASW